MDFDTYQAETRRTTQKADEPTDSPVGVSKSLMVYLLGLAGEAGSVDTVYKKHLRDQDAYPSWKMQLREELGDVLWYVAAIADELGLGLGDIAQSNLNKTKSRWLPSTNYQLDEGAPEGEQLPRSGTMIFHQTINDDGRPEVTVTMDGIQIGDPLTDNALSEDGYRFHDVFHLTYAAILGWSPVMRKLLGRKRRSNPDIDETEDGGRAIVTEEGVAGFAFAYATLHNMLEGIDRIDQSLLASIGLMTSTFEVGARTAADWETAILEGHRMFRELVAHGGGSIAFDAEAREVHFEPPAPGGKPAT